MDPQLEEPDFRAYLGVIARRRLVILAVVLGVGGTLAALADPRTDLSLQGPGVDDGVQRPARDMVFDANDSGRLSNVRPRPSRPRWGVQYAQQRGARAYDGPLGDSEIYNVAVAEVGGGDPNKTSSVLELSLVLRSSSGRGPRQRVRPDVLEARPRTVNLAHDAGGAAGLLEEFRARDRRGAGHLSTRSTPASTRVRAMLRS